MCYNGETIAGDEVAESFAQFFEEKVSKTVNSAQIDRNVSNGSSKMVAGDSNFMTTNEIYKCVKQ